MYFCVFAIQVNGVLNGKNGVTNGEHEGRTTRERARRQQQRLQQQVDQSDQQNAVAAANNSMGSDSNNNTQNSMSAFSSSSEDTNDSSSENESTPPRVTTRRAWSDYCSNSNSITFRGRSSHSEEDNNPSNGSKYRRIFTVYPTLTECSRTIVVLGQRKEVPKKRLKKKSTRNINVPQPPIGNSDNSNMSQASNARARARKAKGRLGKKKAKKTIRINGLDLLHNQTLLSTSPQGKPSIIDA